jgi:hypothetical protein
LLSRSQACVPVHTLLLRRFRCCLVSSMLITHCAGSQPDFCAGGREFGHCARLEMLPSDGSIVYRSQVGNWLPCTVTVQVVNLMASRNGTESWPHGRVHSGRLPQLPNLLAEAWYPLADTMAQCLRLRECTPMVTTLLLRRCARAWRRTGVTLTLSE